MVGEPLFTLGLGPPGMRDLKKAFREAIREFNEFRSPEAVAELVHAESEIAVVRMSGSFCASCGLFDYFEDLAWMVRDLLGEEVSVEAADRVGHDEYLVLYRVGGGSAEILREPEPAEGESSGQQEGEEDQTESQSDGGSR